jgi:hypothetical protein
MINEKYSNLCIGKQLIDNFLIQNGLKQGDASLALIFNRYLQEAIRKFQENHLGLNINGKHHLLAYADDVKSTVRKCRY